MAYIRCHSVLLCPVPHPIPEVIVTTVAITKEKTNPLALQASIGGTKELGYYLVWRGDDPEAVLDMLRDVLKAAEDVLPMFNRPQG